MHLPHIAYTVLVHSIVASHVQTTRTTCKYANQYTRVTYHCHTGRRCILLLLLLATTTTTTTTTIAANATAVRLGVGLAAELRHGQLAAVVQIVVVVVVVAVDGLLLGWPIRLLLVMAVVLVVRLIRLLLG